MKKKCYLVITADYWGVGQTLKEAAKKCQSQGSPNRSRAIARLVVGDDKATIECGFITREADSEIYGIGDGFRLGDLIRLEPN